MNDLIRAELSKLRSTRSTRALTAVAVAYPLLGLLPALLAPAAERATSMPDDVLTAVRSPFSVIAFTMLVVGVLATAGEFRHGTIVATLLVAPRRRRLVAAKAVAVASVAAGAAAAASVVGLLGGLVLFRLAGHDVPAFAGDLPAVVAALMAVAAAYGLVGVGVGLLVRDQTVAITVALVWTTLIEGMLPVVLRAPGMRRWMLGDAAHALVNVGGSSTTTLGPVAAALLVVSVTVALLLAGGGRFVRSDVTV